MEIIIPISYFYALPSVIYKIITARIINFNLAKFPTEILQGTKKIIYVHHVCVYMDFTLTFL